MEFDGVVVTMTTTATTTAATTRATATTTGDIVLCGGRDRC